MGRTTWIALAFVFLASAVRADTVAITGTANAISSPGWTFSFSGPGVSLFGRVIGVTNLDLRCSTSSCEPDAVVETLFDPEQGGDSESGTIGGVTANFTPGLLNFTAGSITLQTGHVLYPVTFSGELAGYDLPCPLCTFGPPLWTVTMSGTGTVDFDFSCSPSNVCMSNDAAYSLVGTATFVPEPSTLALLEVGLSAIALFRSHRYSDRGSGFSKQVGVRLHQPTHFANSTSA